MTLSRFAGNVVLLSAAGLFGALLFGSAWGRADETGPVVPRIEGPWWKIAGNPDLGEQSDPKQQPVDFAIWQAADGTWQLWSCIRHTRCGGRTRLFYRWEAKELTESNWRPCGVAMTADERFGETPGGLQAPHVIRVGDVWQMLYGHWHGIALARSSDGKQFERVVDDAGKSQLFSEDQSDLPANTRDPMVLPIESADGVRYYCYYTAHPNQRGAVYLRVSKDLKHWSESKIVARGGRAGEGPYAAECPHVVARHGAYYLFRTQRYGKNAQTLAYRSTDPADFGIDDDRFLVAELPVAAPEVIHFNGADYLAALLPTLDGIQVAKLRWEKSPPAKLDR